MSWLIDANQLDKLKKAHRHVALFDATWFLDPRQHDPLSLFEKAHIPGARFLDLTLFHDDSSPLPNMMLRDEALVSQRLASQGISPDTKIILYDQSDHHTACRALWMFRFFGHSTHQLYILNGGLHAWLMAGKKVETGSSLQPKQVKPYPVQFQSHLLRTLVQMKANCHHPHEQVIDLRHAIRFAGGAEPRPHLRSGHIPGSFSFPYTSFFEPDGHFKPLDKIRRLLLSIGLDWDAPMVSTCGSGMTACILNTVLEWMNEENHALYDGAWAEWGGDALYPGEESLDERPVQTSLVD